MTKKIVNGVIEDMTPEELSQKEIDKTNTEAEVKAYEEAKQAKETAQANGNQKLLDLGLTQAEATALTGYTPPVAE
ncbi:hypothetical protein P031_gp40 [Pelagibacter phage HTVC031P]|nr:hypothetical protein P031_gp40 [Pelagibacter phage HTVC031P]